jgi:glycosyltransferase involved in cell wall biosynthesis
LSVIVPFFNVERYVAENLRSLAHNAAADIEFVLVDDGSTDATSSLVAEGVERLTGANLVRLTRNSGLSAARNAGLTAARGRYLSFLDGDDVAAPGHFRALIQTIDRLGCDFVRTDHVEVSGQQRSLHRISHAPRGLVCPARSGIGTARQRSSVDFEPQHPSSWHPRIGDLPLWERHFRQLWELGSSDLHLVVESIHVNPAQALCRIFGDARIDVYAEGLMSYGPTRSPFAGDGFEPDRATAAS